MTLPVSVVIPHRATPMRRAALTEWCLPSILANGPAEVIVIPNNGERFAGYWRNRGASMATQPFIFFADDDIFLYSYALRALLDKLEGQPDTVAFAYSGYFLFEGLPSLKAAKDEVPSRPWNVEELRKGNFISSMALVRRSRFPGFDPEIQRLHDWDLWLTMAAHGLSGAFFPKPLFETFVFDKGVSASMSDDEALRIVKAKHGLS